MEGWSRRVPDSAVERTSINRWVWGCSWHQSGYGDNYLDLFPGGRFNVLDMSMRFSLVMFDLCLLSQGWATSWDSNNLIVFSSFICSRRLNSSFTIFDYPSFDPFCDILSTTLERFTTTNLKFQSIQINNAHFNTPPAFFHSPLTPNAFPFSGYKDPSFPAFPLP